MELTVTQKALIDWEQQTEMAKKRLQMLGNGERGLEDTGGHPWPPEMVDKLAAPVRLELTFGDPIHTRRQIEALQAALVEALVVTQDHQRGIVRQRLDARNILKAASTVLVYMNGRAPSGKKKQKPA